MDWNDVDWNCLKRLRNEFLGEMPGASADYWASKGELEHYDFTFARRIGWKWDAVLEELRERNWTPGSSGTLVDWGCGTGVATRKLLSRFGGGHFSRALLFDRSPLAREFAEGKVKELFPALEIQTASVSPKVEGPYTLVVSHVANELDASGEEALLALARGADSLLWVEPGTPTASRRLIAVREGLRSRLHPVAPCPHGGPCGLSAPQNSRHWCHHFASPPQEVFLSGDWDRFFRTLGIDRRSLPVSYLVLDRKAPSDPPGSIRVIGRPRRHKGDVSYLGCELSGLSEGRVLRKADPATFERLSEDAFSVFLDGPQKV